MASFITSILIRSADAVCSVDGANIVCASLTFVFLHFGAY